MKPLKTSLIALATVASLASPVLASNASLAHDVGVPTGMYSRSQLIQLKAADEHQQATRAYILAHPAGSRGAQAGWSQQATAPQAGYASSQADSKLAASVGVAPGHYSVPQMIQLEMLQNGGKGDIAQADYILAHPAGHS